MLWGYILLIKGSWWVFKEVFWKYAKTADFSLLPNYLILNKARLWLNLFVTKLFLHIYSKCLSPPWHDVKPLDLRQNRKQGVTEKFLSPHSWTHWLILGKYFWVLKVLEGPRAWWREGLCKVVATPSQGFPVMLPGTGSWAQRAPTPWA